MAKKPTVKRMRPQRMWGVVWEGNVEPDAETLRYTRRDAEGQYHKSSCSGKVESFILTKETKGGKRGKAK